MRIACVGGGPAGLYFAISMKLRSSEHDITVFERNRPDDTFGWGVVFSDSVLADLERNDPPSAAMVTDGFIHWDEIEVCYKDEVIRSGGHGFCGIGRQHLLDILYKRAAELGVKLVFETEVKPDMEQFADYDLVIASDGINSRFREAYKEHLDVDIDVRPNKFLWLGTNKLFDAFTFIFKETPAGWIWVHAYCFDKNTSTFIVECEETTWEKLGFGQMSQEECSRYLEDMFSDYLDGNTLMRNVKHVRGSAWISFPRILCGQWRYKNLPRYTYLEPMQFNYALLTRSQRVSHENLRLRDPVWLESMERWFLKKSIGESLMGGETVPPMFVPFKLRDMVLKNRVVVSPMAMYSAVDGVPNDFHLVHYGARAQGGVGLVITEMIGASADGRITPACAAWPGRILQIRTGRCMPLRNWVSKASTGRFSTYPVAASMNAI